MSAALVVAGADGCGPRLPDGWVYVSRVDRNAATVVWTGRGDEVSCRASDGSTVRAAAAPGDTAPRFARVGGLAAGTRYVCRVAGAVRPLLVRFVTAPAEPEPFVFAAVGDSGDGSHAAAVLARRILAGRPAFLVHLGDMAYGSGTPAELDTRFFRPYHRLLARVPLFPTPGNHDLGRQSAYRMLFRPIADDEDAGGPRYAFDWGAAHLVSLSSPSFGADGPGPRWLAADLAAARVRPWRIVFLHEPVYSAGAKFVVRGLRATLEPLLETGGTDLLLTGHQHFYERAEASCEHVAGAAVLEVISGGGGANLDPPAAHPNFPRTVSATHYVRVRVSPEAIDLRAIASDGRVLDHVRRRRAEVPMCRSSGWPRPRAR